jgi:hypothetical protein
VASRIEPDLDTGLQTGRRAAPRLRLSLPATFMSTKGNHGCIITNLSRTGVLIAIRHPLEIGKDGFLRSGPIDHFVTVTRKEYGLNALEFEAPVSHDFVMQVRHFQENLAAREREELMASARRWTLG